MQRLVPMTDDRQNIAWSVAYTAFGAVQAIATPSKAGFAGVDVIPPHCPIGRQDTEYLGRRRGPNAARVRGASRARQRHDLGLILRVSQTDVV